MVIVIIRTRSLLNIIYPSTVKGIAIYYLTTGDNYSFRTNVLIVNG